MESALFIIGLIVGVIATTAAVCIAFICGKKEPVDDKVRELQILWQDRLFPNVFDDRLIEVQTWQERKQMLDMYRQVLRARTEADFDGLEDRYKAWMENVRDRRIRPEILR